MKKTFKLLSTVLLSTCLLFAVGCSKTAKLANAEKSDKVASTEKENRIGIIGAMAEEVEILKNEMKIDKTVEIASMKFYVGELENKPVVVVQSGIGKVNAANCAQILITSFNATSIMNTGCAGAINDDLNVGDTVISTSLMEHDFDCTAFGMKLGEIPRMDSSVFTADKKLIDTAFEAAKKVNNKNKTIKGIIVSGDVFVSSAEKKKLLQETFTADAAEMEGAAIAHTCSINKVPFVVIRSMSDKADGKADVTYEEFVKEASKTSSKIVKAMLSKL